MDGVDTGSGRVTGVAHKMGSYRKAWRHRLLQEPASAGDRHPPAAIGNRISGIRWMDGVDTGSGRVTGAAHKMGSYRKAWRRRLL